MSPQCFSHHVHCFFFCCRPRAHFSLQQREYFEHFSRGIFQCTGPPRPPRTLRRAFFTGARTTRVALTQHLFLHIFGANRCRFDPVHLAQKLYGALSWLSRPCLGPPPETRHRPEPSWRSRLRPSRAASSLLRAHHAYTTRLS